MTKRWSTGHMQLAACLTLALACGDTDGSGGGTGSGTSHGGGTGTDTGAGTGTGDGGSDTGDGGGTGTESDDGGGTGGGFDPDVLTEQGGCSDVILYAYDVEQTWLLYFRTVDHPAEAAHAEGTTQELAYTLPDPSVELDLQQGSGLAEPVCNDYGGSQIDRTFAAISGSAELVVVPKGTPEPWEVPADASLVLQDIVLEDPESGDTIQIGHYEFADISVGWFPG